MLILDRLKVQQVSVKSTESAIRQSFWEFAMETRRALGSISLDTTWHRVRDARLNGSLSAGKIAHPLVINSKMLFGSCLQCYWRQICKVVSI